MRVAQCVVVLAVVMGCDLGAREGAASLQQAGADTDGRWGRCWLTAHPC